MKKNNLILLLLTVIISIIASCDLLQQQNLSEEEVIEGLKTALEIGSDSACTSLNKNNGYYGNQLVKILLPPQAQEIINLVNNPTIVSLGIDIVLNQKIEDVVLSINRAAENAAKDAKPIFVDAIRNMTVTDGLIILQGNDKYAQIVSNTTTNFDSLAATNFMIYTTKQQLYNLYEPKINEQLSKDLGLGFSANDAWSTLLYYYNNYLATIISNLKPIDQVNLSQYCTNKGLDGLFIFVGKQEKQIRKDPYKWSQDIIQKVFGSVYQEPKK